MSKVFNMVGGGGGGGGGPAASIFVKGLSQTDTVTATNGSKTKTGVWTQKPNPEIVVPDGYTQLEYIESSGTQYIDTEFKPNGTTKIVCDFQMVNQGTEQQGVFGSRPGESRRFSLFTGHGTSSLQVDYNTSESLAISGNSISGLNLNNRNTIEVSNSLIINGNTIKTVSAVSFTSTYNLFLFANNNVGTAQLLGTLKLYSCQIYDNGLLVRDFIPCKKANGTVGMLDNVNSVFYGNAGTGVFTAGAEVPQTIYGFLIKPIRDFGTWTVTATDGAKTATQDVLVDVMTEYEIEMSLSA